ncbi:hypothetical protein C8J57DRAFT_1725748 [Mycena rebaudengoi]|nr:hypothetical protein C8J57DRAFT_1151787 [Mycena rebaudengoi]KAJ7244368.1 hypothetical protein C8J57DRAFT_1725748 [Mycena rebaudengoi]
MARPRTRIWQYGAITGCVRDEALSFDVAASSLCRAGSLCKVARILRSGLSDLAKLTRPPKRSIQFTLLRLQLPDFSEIIMAKEQIYTALPSQPLQYPTRPGGRRLHLGLPFALGLSLLWNAVLLWSWLRSEFRLISSESVYSPAQHVVEYKTVRFHRGFYDDIPIYEQPPTDEVDDAWESLYAVAASRIPKSEALKLTNKTWPIVNEDGNFLVALDVFHTLHCLDMLRQAVHPGHGYTKRPRSHLRHCIGAIRQALMCSVDITPIVWQWSDKFREAEQRDDILHTCRDFDKIRNWAEERSMGDLPDLTLYVEG